MAKVKTVYRNFSEVKDYEEGTGRNKGKLGAIIVEGKDEKQKL